MLDADFECWTSGEWRCRMEECSGCRKSLDMPDDCLEMPEEQNFEP